MPDPPDWISVRKIVFAWSTSLALTMAALAVLGASDMFSIVIRQTLVQLETPDAMRGRVSAVNTLFVGTANRLGDFRAGLTAAWFGTVPAVLIGGIATWYWYDDLVPDDDAYVTTLAEVPYCDDDSDDCGVRPVPARARPAPAARRGCLVSVYDERDFDGNVWTTSADQPDLGDKWSNRITSVQVISGTWDFFLEPKYQNEMLTLENGTYSYVGDDWKDQINSFRCTPQ